MRLKNKIQLSVIFFITVSCISDREIYTDIYKIRNTTNKNIFMVFYDIPTLDSISYYIGAYKDTIISYESSVGGSIPLFLDHFDSVIITFNNTKELTYSKNDTINNRSIYNLTSLNYDIIEKNIEKNTIHIEYTYTFTEEDYNNADTLVLP